LIIFKYLFKYLFQNLTFFFFHYILYSFYLVIFYFLKAIIFIFQFITFILRKSCFEIFYISQFLCDMKTNYDELKEQSNINQKKLFDETQLIILEQWYQDNRDFPYANSIIKQELARKTNLSEKQIKNWIDHKRAYIRKHQSDQQSSSNRCFSPNIRLVLNEFYQNNQNPNVNELQHLVSVTGLTVKQVKCWFSKRKFRAKH